MLLVLACAAELPPDKPGSRDSSPSADTSLPEDTADSGADDAPLPAGLTIYDHVTVADAGGARADRAVLVLADVIHAETAAAGDWPEDAVVVDASGLFLVPGLVDAHVHLGYAGTIDRVGDTLAENLRATLYHGVTQVVDLGGPTVLFDVRDAGLGPRILAAGPFLTAVGSHPCESWPDPDLCRFVDATDAGSEAEALVAEGADVLKVALADASFAPLEPTPRLDLAALAGVVATGAPVFAHIDEEDDLVDAVAAGVSVLAHPVFASDLGSDLGTPTISTISAFAGVGRLLDGETDPHDPELLLTDATRADWAAVQAHPELLSAGWAEASADWAAFAKANLERAEVVLPGSDAGYYFVPHGAGLHWELQSLSGTPLEILTAATLTSREILGLPGGKIEAGAPADFLLLRADPLAAVEALDDIHTVVLRGVPWSREELRTADLDGADHCLSDADCGAERCDGVTHRCAKSCDPPYLIDDDCGADAWCMPADGADAATGVCHVETTCDLYEQDCAPDYYERACIPYDADTSACWYAGPRRAGEWCDSAYAATSCEAGHFCSSITAICYRLCDPDAADTCPGATRCWRQVTTEGDPWFGLCY